MAKANVGKFYDKLAQDAALAEKLNALDKDFVEKNEAPADGADLAFREKAVAAIVIPLAEEVGLPFTLEELKEYEQEQLKEMNLSEDELDQVAGGRGKPRPEAKGKGSSKAVCAIVGIGAGIVKDKKRNNTAACFVLGFSNGRVCTSE